MQHTKNKGKNKTFFISNNNLFNSQLQYQQKLKQQRSFYWQRSSIRFYQILQQCSSTNLIYEFNFIKFIKRKRNHIWYFKRSLLCYSFFQKTKELGYITQGIQRNPGVGNYNCSNCYDSKIQYTMRPKTQSNWLPNFLKEQNLDCIPGPGQYESKDIDQMGNSNYARYQSSRCYKIGKQERFNKIRYSSPGPNTYKQTDGLNDSGQYYESKHRGQGKRIICKEPRRSFIDQIYQKGNYEKKYFNYSSRILDSQINLCESEF
ncbi:unnamed protein product [Paramecium sonneborni]|uniref:Uncharacterized protein n=1 Tax=Paramecium sonneborni TaxID=65129 RepID=A0A8S1R8D9_9CILI|nr:unnamed protein product [Paramecium sonneborni]